MRLHPIFLFALICLIVNNSRAIAASSKNGTAEDSFKPQQCQRTENPDVLNSQSWVTKQGNCLPSNLASPQADFVRLMLYPADFAPVTALDVSGLDALLAEIKQPQNRSTLAQWWDYLLNWLKGLETRQNGDEFKRLLAWLKTVIPSVETARAMLYGVLAITILSAAGLVIHELYLSGWLYRIGGKLRRIKVNNGEIIYTENKTGGHVDLENLPPVKQVALMLKQCIEILAIRHDMPDNRSLTNYELCRYLQQKHADSANAFASLAELSEPVLYGGVIPSPQILLLCQQRSRQILDS